jgi:hypothetical protein
MLTVLPRVPIVEQEWFIPSGATELSPLFVGFVMLIVDE